MRHFLLIFLFALYCSNIKAQTLEVFEDSMRGTFKKQTNLITGVNSSEFAFQETMVSPLIYRGTGIGLQIGFEKNKLNKITYCNINWTKAKMNNLLQPKQYNAELTNFNTSVGVCYRASKMTFPHYSNFLGWQLAQHSDFRRISQFQNASLSYNFSVTLAPVYRAKGYYNLKENPKRKLLKKGINLDWSYQIAFPLAALIARPNFNAIRILHDGNGNIYQNSITEEVIQNFSFYTLNKLIALDQQFEVQYALNSNNKMALQFKWYFEYFDKTHFAYTTSNSGVYLCFYTQLN